MVLMPGFQSTRLATEGALEPFFFLYTDDSIHGNPETCKRSSIMLNYEVKNSMSILYYANLPDYLVLNSLSCSNGLNRDTTLKVVVYQYWNIDQLVSEIEEKHNKLNGTPTILTVELYPSKWFFQNGYGPFYTTTIHYH